MFFKEECVNRNVLLRMQNWLMEKVASRLTKDEGGLLVGVSLFGLMVVWPVMAAFILAEITIPVAKISNLTATMLLSLVGALLVILAGFWVLLSLLLVGLKSASKES